MTPPSDERFELASAHLDGETTAEEQARIAADPTLGVLVDELAAARGVFRTPIDLRGADRERHIDAALGLFDELNSSRQATPVPDAEPTVPAPQPTASTPVQAAASGDRHEAPALAAATATTGDSGGSVSSLEAARERKAQRSPRFNRIAGVAAAVALLFIGITALTRLNTSGSDTSVVADSADSAVEASADDSDGDDAMAGDADDSDGDDRAMTSAMDDEAEDDMAEMAESNAGNVAEDDDGAALRADAAEDAAASSAAPAPEADAAFDSSDLDDSAMADDAELFDDDMAEEDMAEDDMATEAAPAQSGSALGGASQALGEEAMEVEEPATGLFAETEPMATAPPISDDPQTPPDDVFDEYSALYGFELTPASTVEGTFSGVGALDDLQRSFLAHPVAIEPAGLENARCQTEVSTLSVTERPTFAAFAIVDGELVEIHRVPDGDRFIVVTHRACALLGDLLD